MKNSTFTARILGLTLGLILAVADDAGAGDLAPSRGGNVALEPAGIDLEQDGDISAVASRLEPGTRFEVSGAVANRGEIPSGDFRIDFFLSKNTTITPADTMVGSTQVISVDPGRRRVFFVDIDVPAANCPGYWYLGWIIDAGGAVAESDEGNNDWYKRGTRWVGTVQSLQLAASINSWKRRIQNTSKQIRKAKRIHNRSVRNRKLRRLRGKLRRFRAQDRAARLLFLSRFGCSYSG